MIREILEAHIEAEHEKSDRRFADRAAAGNMGPRLHPSTVGYCRRKVMLTAVQHHPEDPWYVEKTHPFDLYTKSVMHSGRVWEQANTNAIAARLGNKAVGWFAFNVPPWAAELDILLSDGTIVEHKDTAEYNFKARGRLPYKHHCIQLVVYDILLSRHIGEAGRVFSSQNAEKPNEHQSILYYNGRGHWAEFEVGIEEIGWAEEHENGASVIHFEGYIDGQWRGGYHDFDVPREMAELERLFGRCVLPEPPETPTSITEWGHCVRGSEKKGFYPACPWFGYCWTLADGWPQDGPIKVK